MTLRALNVPSVLLAALTLTLFSSTYATAANDVSSSKARRYESALKKLLKLGDADELENFIEKMAEHDHPKTIVLIPPAAVIVPSAVNHKRAVEAIKESENEEAIETLVKLLDSSKTRYQEKVLVIEAFGFREDEASLGAIVEAIEHKIVHVRLAAIRATMARRAKETIEPLIATIKKHEKLRGLTWLEAREALLALTDQDFPTHKDWGKWWKGNGGNFDPKKLDEKEKGGKGKTIVVKKSKDSVEFFGAEIFSRNVLFVIDVSLSMLKYDEGDYKGRNVEEDRRRLRRAKIQLAKALKMLPRTARFNIITFGNRVTPWQKGLKTASKSTVRKALKFVQDLKGIPATHTDEALELAFTDHSVDTIVLLSDGAPVKRGARDSVRLIEKILKRVKDLNASRQVRINCFGFEGIGEWPHRAPGLPPGPKPQPKPEEVEAFVQFLKDLAKNNRGIYRAIE